MNKSSKDKIEITREKNEKSNKNTHKEKPKENKKKHKDFDLNELYAKNDLNINNSDNESNDNDDSEHNYLCYPDSDSNSNSQSVTSSNFYTQKKSNSVKKKKSKSKDDDDYFDDDKDIRRHLKDVNYNMNKRINGMEKKIDNMIFMMEKIMQTWVGTFKDVKDELKTNNAKLLQIEKDLQVIKNKKAIYVDNQNSNSNPNLSSFNNKNEDDYGNKNDESIHQIHHKKEESNKKTLPNSYLAKFTIDSESNDLSPVALNRTNSLINKNSNLPSSNSSNSLVTYNSQQNQSNIHNNYNHETQLTLWSSNNQVQNQNKNHQNQHQHFYRNIKPELFNIPDEFVKKCLEMNNMGGEIKLFQKMYIENIPKEYIPIRHIKKKFQYWLDGHMNDDDLQGTYIKNTILNNIEMLYMKINLFDIYSADNNAEQFLSNQEHIGKLSQEKYKEKFLQQIIPFIDI